MSSTKAKPGIISFGAAAITGALCCSLAMIAVPVAAFAAQTAADPAGLMRQAGALEAASQWEQAAKVYDQAARAYAAAGQTTERTQALEKSATMYEKFAYSLTNGAPKPAAPVVPGRATPAAKQAAPEAQPIPATSTEGGATPLPLERSPIVHAGKHGGLAVAAANGAPIDGVKLSKHDTNIQTPAIVVAPNGTIHVAFLEQQARGIECAIYHRSSSDGGRTWSEAKNLSEVMPDLNVGKCQIAADAAGRIYVVWRAASAQYARADIDPHAGPTNNLVYRVLSGGQWNGKAIPIHPMATQAKQDIGSASYFVSTDPTGNVHVIWNENPDVRHPEVMFGTAPYRQHSSTVGDGLVMESTLNGTTPSAPREIYMTPVSKPTNGMGPICDTLDMMNGYVDAADQAHFVSYVASVRGDQTQHFQLIENGTQTPAADLPGSTFEYWSYPPTLLVDAEGRKHVVTLYPKGEQPNVRDYTIGSDSEPKTIRSVKGVAGKLLGFEAFQGPAGRMVAIMHINDTGQKTDEELYVSMSSGGQWSTPINVTNNSGRLAFHSTNTSARSNVATMSWGYPGAAAATFDKSGHLLLIYVRNKLEVFGSSAFGVELAGGSTATPNLMFLRF